MDSAQRYVIGLGLLSSSICCFLGFPCAEGFAVFLFRCTCVGFFSGNLVASLVGRPQLRIPAFRFALVSNSLASWLVSFWWCLGFGDWCILMFLEHAFMLVGVIVLLQGTGLVHHMIFTFAGSIVGFVGRDVDSFTMSPDERFLAQRAARAWIMMLVFTVFALVAGMSFAGYTFVDNLRQKAQVVWKVLTEPDMSDPSKVGVSSMSGSTYLSSGNSSWMVHPGSHTSGFEQGSLSSASSDRRENEISFLRPDKPPFEDVSLVKEVGHGSFGRVYMGLWRGSAVAVKVIPWNPSRPTKSSPMKEAALSATLAHPNLVQTYKYSSKAVESDNDGTDAASAEQKHVWIVQEWCDLGTLGSWCTAPRRKGAGLVEVFSVCADIAAAGAYLHARGIIHGDLTSNNVLRKHDASPRGFLCKVCDFGLARVLGEAETQLLTTQLGTVSHMPPELFSIDKKQVAMTQKVDIYAMGMLLWQAVHGEFPFTNRSPAQIILSVAKGRDRKSVV